MDTLLGLPAHVLLVHAVVVLCPLAALTGLAMALRPRWAFYLRWPLVVLALLSAGFALLSASAGESLEHRLGRDARIEAHAEDGDLLKIVALLYLAAAVLTFLSITVHSPLQSGRGAFTSKLPPVVIPVARVLLAAAALWLLVQTVLTGHSGSSAAWADIVESTQ